jgi:hypothetical protein
VTVVIEDAVARLTNGQSYATLQEAIDAAAVTDTITLLKDVSMTSAAGTVTIPSGKTITLIAGTGGHTIRRGASGFGSLITVAGSLELGGVNDLILDGGESNRYTATAALIIVSGTLSMSNTVTLKNNDNTSDVYGGGVMIDTGGTFTMNGGTITGNTAGAGGGVYTLSTFTMSGGNITGNAAQSGGGVVVGGGIFTMSGGTISGNTAFLGFGSSLNMTFGTAKYGGSLGSSSLGKLYTSEDLPYDDGSGGDKDPAPQN